MIRRLFTLLSTLSLLLCVAACLLWWRSLTVTSRYAAGATQEVFSANGRVGVDNQPVLREADRREQELLAEARAWDARNIALSEDHNRMLARFDAASMALRWANVDRYTRLKYWMTLGVSKAEKQIKTEKDKASAAGGTVLGQIFRRSQPPLVEHAVPYWVIVAVGGAGFAARVGASAMGRRRQRRLHRLGLCPACGYDLRASPGRCPECGAVPPVKGVA
jgi:hypothetical protein